MLTVAVHAERMGAPVVPKAPHAGQQGRALAAVGRVADDLGAGGARTGGGRVGGAVVDDQDPVTARPDAGDDVADGPGTVVRRNEDGRLEGNPIAQGSVDSTFSLRLVLAPRDRGTAHYWIAAGKGFEEARRLHRLVRREGVSALLEQTRRYWRSWLAKGSPEFKDLGAGVASLFKRSLLVIRTQIDKGGAILAANDLAR